METSAAKLTICRGLPASGKSTWAKNRVQEDIGNTVRVNRDLLRVMLNNDVFVKGVTERVTLSARDSLIEKFLKMGLHVISDDTNLAAHQVKPLAKIAYKYGVEVEVKDFDIDVEECIRRDSARSGKGEITVGVDVIRDLHKRFFNKGFPKNPLLDLPEVFKVEPYVPDVSLPKAVIFDIDGTLADHRGLRSPYDYTQVHLDTPRQAVIDAARLYADAGINIVIFSGRDGSCRPATLDWLTENVQRPFVLDMRTADDERKDYIIKYELFTKWKDKYNFVAVYDDRKQVLDLWQALELTTFNVSIGDNDF